MLPVRDIVRRLARRDRHLHGLSFASWTLAATSLATLVAVGALALARRPTVPGMLLVPVAVSALAYGAGARRCTPLALLLLRVDEQLGLAARLSSLFELSQRTPMLPTEYALRIERDLVHSHPRWKRGLPLPRRTAAAAAGGALLWLAGAALFCFVPAEVLRPSPGAVDRPPALAAVVEPAAGHQPSGAPPSHPLPARAVALADVLAEIRPAARPQNARPQDVPSAAATSPSALDLDQLASWRERVAVEAPLQPDEAAALRAAATFARQETRDTLETALAQSDLDTLRRSIEQLIREAEDLSRSPAQQIEPAASTFPPEGEPLPAATSTPSMSPGGASASPGTQGPGREDSSPAAPTPIFDDGVGAVAVVTPVLVVGDYGAVTSYVTRAVPVERHADSTPSGTAVTISADHVASAVRARALPDGAEQVIRDYFTRITEERE